MTDTDTYKLIRSEFEAAGFKLTRSVGNTFKVTRTNQRRGVRFVFEGYYHGLPTLDEVKADAE